MESNDRPRDDESAFESFDGAVHRFVDAATRATPDEFAEALRVTLPPEGERAPQGRAGR